MNLDIEFRLLLLLSAAQAWVMPGKETGVRMYKMSEFLCLTHIFQSQQFFLSISMISDYKYKAGWFLGKYVSNIRVHNQSN